MSLIAWYPLNGDTKDYSGNGYDLINNGATVNNAGKIGKCYNFKTTNKANMKFPFGKGMSAKNLTISM
ncbi:hypothetical protein [Paraclostridium dentum]|uniref:hypothetical protein n=1 Tax=Paraclostridium dentum TaxID=2662455 RepID=UPI003F351A89